MKNIVVEVSKQQLTINGQLLGRFVAIRNSGLVTDADNFVSLAYAEPCWRR